MSKGTMARLAVLSAAVLAAAPGYTAPPPPSPPPKAQDEGVAKKPQMPQVPDAVAQVVMPPSLGMTSVKKPPPPKAPERSA